MNARSAKSADDLLSLLADFAETGAQARVIYADSSSPSGPQLDALRRRAGETRTRIAEIAATRKEDRQYLALYAAGIILASAATDDPGVEEELTALLSRLSQRATTISSGLASADPLPLSSTLSSDQSATATSTPPCSTFETKSMGM